MHHNVIFPLEIENTSIFSACSQQPLPKSGVLQLHTSTYAMSQRRLSSRPGVKEALETLAAQCVLRGDLLCGDKKAAEEVV